MSKIFVALFCIFIGLIASPLFDRLSAEPVNMDEDKIQDMEKEKFNDLMHWNDLKQIRIENAKSIYFLLKQLKQIEQEIQRLRIILQEKK